MTTMTTRTVGAIAEEFGVTVRTLHHYDAIGLLTPSDRAASGYRLYTDDDAARLATIVTYRRLGFGLEDVAVLLADGEHRLDHLRRQRDAVRSRLDELRTLVTALEHAMEKEMTNEPITDADLKEILGDGYDDAWAAQAQERWGDTEAWAVSRRRTKGYGKEQWALLKADSDAAMALVRAAYRAGDAPSSAAAMGAVEAHRVHIDRWFYECTPQFQRGLAQMYAADHRFLAAFDPDAEPEALAAWLVAAIDANAAR